jgi:hypothetical protein
MRHLRVTHFASSLAFIACAAALAATGCTIGFSEATTGSFGGAGGAAPVPVTCGETAACPVSQECLATVENHGSAQFGMRIAELTIGSPEVLSLKGLLGFYLEESFGPKLPACFGPESSVEPAGATSWLLRFDLDQQTLTMGGAAPPAHPKDGYTFIDALVSQGGTTFDVAPVTFDLVTSPDGSFGVTAAADLLLPMWFPSDGLDKKPTGPVVLPLRGLMASDVVVSPSHDCIGHYDPAIFSEKAGCEPTTPGELFVHAGHVSAYVTLEDADGIGMGALGETLCVLLSGNDVKYGDTQTPTEHCKRTGGVIDFKGDWCSATNAPATATCFDAVLFTADFAASAAVINP